MAVAEVYYGGRQSEGRGLAAADFTMAAAAPSRRATAAASELENLLWAPRKKAKKGVPAAVSGPELCPPPAEIALL